MSWSNFLMPASFKGFDFEFNVTDEDLTASKALSVHNYPFVDGAHVEDMGMVDNDITLNIILNGFDYERRLQKLLAVLKERGSGELIHPIYGSLPNTIARRWQVKHAADEIDCCRIYVEFVQDTPNAPFFDRTLSLGFADKLANMIDELKGSAFNNLNSWLSNLEAYSNQISNVAYVISSALSYGASLIGAVVTAGLDLINSPRTIIADIASIFGRIGSMGTWSTNTTTSDWANYAKQASNIVALPKQVNTGQLTTGNGQSFIQQPVDTESLNQIQIWFDLNAAGEMAQTASDVFSDELEEPTLSPADVEKIVNDVRTQIQDTITLIRETESYVDAPTTIDALRDLALVLQEQAEAVINQRPPLIQKTVEVPSNLHLIAFRWYGDASRAGELLRLNPDIQHPSFIERGRILNAYAK